MVKTSVRKWREPFTCSQVKEGSLVIQSHAALKTPSWTFQRHLISLIYRYQAKIVLWSTFNVKNVQDFLWFEKCKIAMNVWIHNKDGELIYQFNCMVVAFRTMLSAACEVMSLRLFNKNNIHKNYQGALPLLYYKPTETRETFCIIINFCSFMHPFFFASLSGSHCCATIPPYCNCCSDCCSGLFSRGGSQGQIQGIQQKMKIICTCPSVLSIIWNGLAQMSLYVCECACMEGSTGTWSRFAYSHGVNRCWPLFTLQKLPSILD